MDAELIVADYFDALTKRRSAPSWPTGVSRSDQVIWHVIATRCDMDISGFGSVFEQLFTREELLFLIQSLRDLNEPALAIGFERAVALLDGVGFFGRNGGLSASEIAALDAIEVQLRETERLWGIDDKLLKLVPQSFRDQCAKDDRNQ